MPYPKAPYCEGAPRISFVLREFPANRAYHSGVWRMFGTRGRGTCARGSGAFTNGYTEV